LWNALTRPNSPFRKNAREDREILPLDGLRDRSRRTHSAFQSDRAGNNGRGSRRIARHHDSTHAECRQFRDQGSGVDALRIAQRDEAKFSAGRLQTLCPAADRMAASTESWQASELASAAIPRQMMMIMEAESAIVWRA